MIVLLDWDSRVSDCFINSLCFMVALIFDGIQCMCVAIAERQDGRFVVRLV